MILSVKHQLKNSKEEKEGIWYEIDEATAFRVKRFGGENADAVKRAMAQHYKPYASRIEKGVLDQKKEDEKMQGMKKGGITGGRKKLDVNKDGKISGEDFEILRGKKNKMRGGGIAIKGTNFKGVY